VPNVSQAKKSFWIHLKELLGEWVMWILISIHLETMLVSVQDRWTVCAERINAHKSFWMHPMKLLDDVRHVESCFGLLGDNVSVGAM
jgi:hypothetical protein